MHISRGCAIKWGCMKFIRLGHRVTRAEWSETGSEWNVTVEVVATGDVIQDRCDVLLSATGVLK